MVRLTLQRKRAILQPSASPYAGYGLKRVHCSAFSPILEDSAHLPLSPPPLMREHRLSQADWRFRFYGFSLGEIITGEENGPLEPRLDPRLAWALKHRERFPVDVNRADPPAPQQLDLF